MLEIDNELAQRYGAYASYATPDDPIRRDDHHDNPAEAMDALLDKFALPGSRVLDLGCGAGFTLCRLAPKVETIWGIDLEEPLFRAAEARVAAQGVTNARLILGNTTSEADIAALPDNYFDFAFSRRGPNLTQALLAKLKPNAHWVQELAMEALGLKDLFGRNAILPNREFAGAEWLVGYYAGLEMLPVSVRHFFYEDYYRDIDHLEAALTHGSWLSHWWLERREYEPSRDRAALELYARYNQTSEGVRVIGQRKVYLFRRARTNYYPVDSV